MANEIEKKIEVVRNGCNGIIWISPLDYIRCANGNLCPECQARLEKLNFANDVLK